MSGAAATSLGQGDLPDGALAGSEERPIRRTPEQWRAIADLDRFPFATPSRSPQRLEHGFEEGKPKWTWTLQDPARGGVVSG